MNDVWCNVGFRSRSNARFLGRANPPAEPHETYLDFFQLTFVQRTLQRHQIKLVTYDPKKEEIRQWIK